MSDARITELLELVTEGVKLPFRPDLIVWFEDHGCTVDMFTGFVTLPIAPETRYEPTRSGKAVSHLLTPPPTYNERIDEAVWLRNRAAQYDWRKRETEDLVEARMDEEFWRSGQW